VNKLEITGDKKLIAAAGNSHIKLFDVNSNSPQETFHYEGHQGNVTAVGFQKDNRWMYTGAFTWGCCRYCRVQSYKRLPSFEGCCVKML